MSGRFALHSVDIPDEVTRRKLDVVAELLDVEDPPPENPVLIVDVSVAVVAVARWRSLMPRVKIFYAVKVNPDKQLLSALHEIGCGFDCASKREMELVLDSGAKPEDIVFSNPNKFHSHISYAAEKGVALTVFDSHDEIYKLKQLHPGCSTLLRISIKSLTSYRDLSRFGADPEDIYDLLKTAYDVGLNVIGVHFHVGVAGDNTTAFREALALSAQAFKIGKDIGLQMRLLDLGGGFPGLADEVPGIEGYATVINRALEEFFPDETIKVIAEPGRYLACRTTGILAKAHSKRVTRRKGKEASFTYFLNDGVFGNLVFVKHFPYGVRNVTLLTRSPVSAEATYPTQLSGPTCTEIDFFGETMRWPEFQVGDYVFMDDNGGYSAIIATSFNGFGKELNRTVYI